MWQTRNHVMDEETKKKISNTIKKFHLNETLEKKKLRLKKRANTIKSWSEERKQEFKRKREKTFLEKYGVKSLTNIQKARRKYVYNGYNFDSQIELAYYIYLIDNHIIFNYHPDVFFEYVYKNETHKYYPDFLVNGEFIELKGSHFLKNDGTWKDPYNGDDEKMECKHQCLLKNNIKIIYDFEMIDIMAYIENAYGKTFLSKFKRQTKTR